jgi:hypothetical protein
MEPTDVVVTFPAGSFAARMTADEIETALRTLGQLWTGADPDDVLSTPQKDQADRLSDWYAEEEEG